LKYKKGGPTKRMELAGISKQFYIKFIGLMILWPVVHLLISEKTDEILICRASDSI